MIVSYKLQHVKPSEHLNLAYRAVDVSSKHLVAGEHAGPPTDNRVGGSGYRMTHT